MEFIMGSRLAGVTVRQHYMIIDFHIVEASKLKALQYTCQLLAKDYQAQNLVYIQTENAEEAERLDALLWTYQDDSFVPHQQHDPQSDCPIQIGFGDIPDNFPIFYNLGREIPTFYAQLRHIIEIVYLDPEIQQLARERFKQYRADGYDINTYKIKAQQI